MTLIFDWLQKRDQHFDVVWQVRFTLQAPFPPHFHPFKERGEKGKDIQQQDRRESKRVESSAVDFFCNISFSFFSCWFLSYSVCRSFLNDECNKNTRYCRYKPRRFSLPSLHTFYWKKTKSVSSLVLHQALVTYVPNSLAAVRIFSAGSLHIHLLQLPNWLTVTQIDMYLGVRRGQFYSESERIRSVRVKVDQTGHLFFSPFSPHVD